MRMTDILQNLFVFFRAVPATLKYGFSGRWWTAEAGNPPGEHRVLQGFLGVGVASGAEPECDGYIIERLRELGLNRVRVDFTYHSRGQYGERFLRRLITEKLKVCLHLVQPFAEAERMYTSEQARKDWRLFVAETLSAYGGAIELVEIGSTCNRRKWSGYSLPGFLAAWKIAHEVAAAGNWPVAGPNVTDFEPVYNIALLSAMKRKHILPAVHTDNLFVERAVEPESYDHKIAGKTLAATFGFNMVRKARMLNDIALAFDVQRTICPHVSWSLRRIARLLDDSEEKQADYLARYCCLAAASGALQQVYWGPLVGQREGLIDDGTTEFPEIPHVTFYGRARGELKNYRKRPAFYALQTVNRFIDGAQYIRKISVEFGLETHEFIAHDGLLHVCWCMNGKRALTRECYPAETLKGAVFFSRDGAKLDRPPVMITESPVYIEWTGMSKDMDEQPVRPSDATSAGQGPPSPGGPAFSEAIYPAPPVNSLRNIRFTQSTGMEYDFMARGNLSGICRAKHGDDILNMIATPGAGKPAGAEILRDARNRVWRVMPGKGQNAAMVVKQFNPLSPARRLFAGHKGDKALRSWNGAQELLRRGIFTPFPVAFFHNPRDPLGTESWYVCDEFGGGFSVRNAFTAFSQGADEFAGIKSEELYNQIAIFLIKMHDRGVYFRDLSAGNLLFRLSGAKTPAFALIDTARAEFHDRATGLRERLCDLMRICHPLCWAGRKKFIARYMALSGRRYRLWMDIVFHYYDGKHLLKGKLRPWRK